MPDPKGHGTKTVPYIALYASDFLADTMHLGDTELGIYWRLLMVYYRDCKPLPADLGKLRRLSMVHGPESEKILTEVMAEFFTLSIELDGTSVWRHKRADAEINLAIERHERKSAGGKLGNARRWAKAPLSHTDHLPTSKRSVSVSESDRNQNQNQNQKELGSVLKHRVEVDGSRKKRATRLPPDWFPGQEGTEFCKLTRPDLNPQTVFDAFKDYWMSQAGLRATKADWMATWRNWVRNQKHITAKERP